MLMTTTMAMTMTTKRRQPNILIAGLGNLLLQDDGVGVHAVFELQKAPPPGALVTEIGTWVLQGLHLYEWADRVLVLDAMQAGGAPGTLYACRDGDVADPGIEASLHELGFMAALKFIKPEKRPEVYILGVEPETIDYGLELTPPVKAVLPRLVQLARETVDRWRLES